VAAGVMIAPPGTLIFISGRKRRDFVATELLILLNFPVPKADVAGCASVMLAMTFLECDAATRFNRLRDHPLTCT
jgi:hypothetical protein